MFFIRIICRRHVDARLCFLALSVAFLMGCARSDPELTTDGRIIVQYWEKWTGFEGEAMQAIINDFNASQDRIFVRKLTVSEIDQKLMLATAGGNPPDIAGLWSFNISVYSEKGALTPLNKWLERDGIGKEDYIPILWELCEHNGFVWGLPSCPASVALHWNKKAFRDAGLDPEQPPRSLKELDLMAERLTLVEVLRNGRKLRLRYSELTEEEKADPDRGFDLIQLGFTPSEPDWWNHSWGFWFNASHWNGDRKITINSRENIEAFTWYQSYPKKYGLKNLQALGASFGNFSSPQNAFLAGKVAMVIQGVWLYNFIEKYNPRLEWGAAPFPSRYPEVNPLVTIAESDVLVVPKGAQHPEEAYEFIRFVNTQPSMEKLNLGQRKFSALSTVSDDFLAKHPNPYIEVFMDLVKSPDARRIPPLSVWNEYSDEVGVAADQIFLLIRTPEEALNTVQTRVQKKFDRILRRWDRIREDRIREWSDL